MKTQEIRHFVLLVVEKKAIKARVMVRTVHLLRHDANCPIKLSNKG